MVGKSLKTECTDCGRTLLQFPEWFMENAGRYDKYDRSGPKVFAGEYAAQSVGVVKPDNKTIG